jgi:hypothetical protein
MDDPDVEDKTLCISVEEPDKRILDANYEVEFDSARIEHYDKFWRDAGFVHLKDKKPKVL